MSLWGNNDGSDLTGTVTTVQNDATIAGSGTDFDGEVNVGDILVIDTVPYRVKSIASDTSLEVTEDYVATGASGLTISVRETPRHLGVTDSNAIFGVDNAEASSGEDNVTEIAIVTSGSGYVNAANADITITGGGGASADGDAVVTNGQVTSVTVTNVGSSYETVPTVTIDPPIASTFDGSDATVVVLADDEIVLTSAQVAALNVSDPITYSNGSGGDITGLVNGTKYYVHSKNGATKIALKTTAGGDTKIDLTVVGTGTSHTFTGDTATATAALGTGGQGITPGWVKRTAGTGGRAGRVHYETLVASGTITGDHENIKFPA